MYFANTPPPVVRFRYEGYIIFSIVMSGLVYPVAAHWGWSAGGWLATTYVGLLDLLYLLKALTHQIHQELF
jgi:hypothetical protein